MGGDQNTTPRHSRNRHGKNCKCLIRSCRGRANVSETPSARPKPATFGEALRRRRGAAGLSQAELAERAGLSVHGISDLERGARLHPHPATVARLANGLGLDDESTAEL